MPQVYLLKRNWKLKESEEDRTELGPAGRISNLRTDIPPGLMIILILVIYTTKIPQALQDRKINTLRAELEAEKAELAKIRLELEEKQITSNEQPITSNE